MKSTPTRREGGSEQKRKTSWRVKALEGLFFGALAIFGFSVVSTIARGNAGAILRFAPALSGATDLPPAESRLRLYEAPSSRPVPAPSLSPIFMPPVEYWKDQILTWAAAKNLDPNLLATVMQIESCGNPVARSGAGASGLFQVMPFHFQESEDPLDPDTNALRGTDYLAKGLETAGGNAGLALAGYNGGHSLISRPYENWPSETQRYYRWGNGIYREASAGWDSSPTLARWLAAGGQSLCDKAQAEIDTLPPR